MERQVENGVVHLCIDNINQRGNFRKTVGDSLQEALGVVVELSDDHYEHKVARGRSANDDVTQQAHLLTGIVEVEVVFQRISTTEKSDVVARSGLQPAMLDVKDFVEHTRHVKT